MGDIDEIFLFTNNQPLSIFSMLCLPKVFRKIFSNFSAVTQKSVVVKISFPKSDMDIFGMYIVPKVQ